MSRMPDWPPMLAAEERAPGTWTMVAPDGREYGLVEIRRLDGRITHRVTEMRQPDAVKRSSRGVRWAASD